jgi:hypothetical protein
MMVQAKWIKAIDNKNSAHRNCEWSEGVNWKITPVRQLTMCASTLKGEVY